MDNHKYYLPNTYTNSDVSFRLLNENLNLIEDFQRRACFSEITYKSFSKNCRYVIIYRSKDEIPYTFEICARWIKELNDFGFPCEIKDCGEKIEFWVDLKNYKYKMHLSSALSLIRDLFESQICFTPEYYFNLIESNPKRNKFLALQKAHEKLSEEDESQYFNSNHIVIGDIEGRKNITLTRLFKRFKNTVHDIYSGRYTKLDKLWDGRNNYYDEFENGGNPDNKGYWSNYE